MSLICVVDAALMLDRRWIPQSDRAIEFRAFFVSSRSLLNRLPLDHPIDMHTILRVHCVLLTKSPCETLKVRWWLTVCEIALWLVC